MSHITYVLMFLFAFHHFLFSSLNQIWRDAYRLFWLLLTLHSYLCFLISTFYCENFQLTSMFSVDSWITALIKTFNKNLHITKCQTVHTRCYQLQLIRQFDNLWKKSHCSNFKHNNILSTQFIIFAEWGQNCGQHLISHTSFLFVGTFDLKVS